MAAIRTRRVLNPPGADAVMRAAEAHAKEHGYRVVIAVVDPAGNLLLLRRLADTQVASSNVAIDKARTSAIFVRPSRVLEEQVSKGRIGALALHGAAPLTGGGWQGPGVSAVQEEPGFWRARQAPLPPGRYAYKFLVNEARWLDDPGNPRKAPDKYGGLNSVLIVPPEWPV
ncbi:MAG: heme-binding protein [Armatimonadota bacterium]